MTTIIRNNNNSITTKTKTTDDNHYYNNEKVIIEKQREEEELKLERKILIVTDGLRDNVVKRLRNIELNKNTNKKISSLSSSKIGRQNIETICDYTIAMIAEINPGCYA
jgi:hypothetical protein